MLFDLDFVNNGQTFTDTGPTQSTITPGADYIYNFDEIGNYQITAHGFYPTLKINPTNLGALIPAIRTSSQIKIKMTLKSGSWREKFEFTHGRGGGRNPSGINIMIDHRSDRAPYLLYSAYGDSIPYSPRYFNVPKDLSPIANLYEEHEWRFEHRLLTNDPDGYVEVHVYMDDALIHTEKNNDPNVNPTAKLEGFYQDMSNDRDYTVFMAEPGSKIASIQIQEKPI